MFDSNSCKLQRLKHLEQNDTHWQMSLNCMYTYADTKENCVHCIW